MKIELHIFRRIVDSDSLSAVMCDDRRVHFYRWNDGLVGDPACNKSVTPISSADDDDFMCESCFAAAQAWMMGGSLRSVQA